MIVGCKNSGINEARLPVFSLEIKYSLNIDALSRPLESVLPELLYEVEEWGYNSLSQHCPTSRNCFGFE